MIIRYAKNNDSDTIEKYDKHISKDILIDSIQNKRVLIIEDGNNFIGWLRFNLFWDNIPFMNMLYILKDYQNNGYGKVLTSFWEKEMKESGYTQVLTSTLSTENAQYFYQKLGYTNIGGFTLPQEPYEIIFYKEL